MLALSWSIYFQTQVLNEQIEQLKEKVKLYIKFIFYVGPNKNLFFFNVEKLLENICFSRC